jgi:hypothetical protein
MFRWAILLGQGRKEPHRPGAACAAAPGRYVEVFTEAEVGALTGLDELGALVEGAE